MGVIISSWTEVLLRYPELDNLPAVSSLTVTSLSTLEANRAKLIAQAEAYVHGRLASGFTVPFSSNNLTAQNLVIDVVYLQNILTRQPIKGVKMEAFLDKQFADLLSGASQMVDVAGTVCQAPAGDPVWSNTMQYHPVFDMNDPSVQAVDSQQLIDANYKRGWPTDEAL